MTRLRLRLAGSATSVWRWVRCRLESLGYFGLLMGLLPLWAWRAVTRTRNRRLERTLFKRWMNFARHGWTDLRRAYWPAIGLERTRDIWFYLAMMEFFAVLNATAEDPPWPGETDRFLVIKLAHFGDALHIFPMLKQLRRQNPDAQVDLLMGPWGAGLARSFGLHDELLIHSPRLGLFDRGATNRRRSLWRELRWLLDLRQRQYSRVLSTSTTSLAELLLMQVLPSGKWVGACLRAGLYPPPRHSVLIPYDSRMHEADRVMGLLALCGMATGPAQLYYPLPSGVLAEAHAGWKDLGIDCPPGCAVMAPGAGWPGKQWPVARFAELGDRLTQLAGLTVVLVGSAGEAGLCAAVAQAMRSPACSLAGRTSLDQLAAILSRAALFIGNDSGPMHLAACFEVPSVVFFGPTIASKWAPRHAAVRILQHEDCAGCISWHFRARCLHGHRCMKTITVDEAWRATQELLAWRPSKKELI